MNASYAVYMALFGLLEAPPTLAQAYRRLVKASQRVAIASQKLAQS